MTNSTHEAAHTPNPLHDRALPWRYDPDLYVVYDADGLAIYEALSATPREWGFALVESMNTYAALNERLEAAEGRLQRVARMSVIRGKCVFCAHPDDPADGDHTSTCPVAPESDPCPYVHDSGDRCVLQFEHGGSHDLGY